mgnify:CR=1 FL=1
MAKGWTVVRMIMILDVDVTAERRHYNTHRPLKGKRLTGFCTSLTLPYKSSSHSAKCVRCASLRSRGRRLAVRTAMEHPIGALPRTPFPASRDFPSRGNERYGEKNRASYTSCTIPVCLPLVAGATTFPPRWEACHWILSRLRLPANPIPLPPPQFGGAAKGKRLNGQARRLTSPHLEVLCRTSTGAL